MKILESKIIYLFFGMLLGAYAHRFVSFKTTKLQDWPIASEVQNHNNSATNDNQKSTTNYANIKATLKERMACNADEIYEIQKSLEAKLTYEQKLKPAAEALAEYYTSVSVLDEEQKASLREFFANLARKHSDNKDDYLSVTSSDLEQILGKDSYEKLIAVQTTKREFDNAVAAMKITSFITKRVNLSPSQEKLTGNFFQKLNGYVWAEVNKILPKDAEGNVIADATGLPPINNQTIRDKIILEHLSPILSNTQLQILKDMLLNEEI